MQCHLDIQRMEINESGLENQFQYFDNSKTSDCEDKSRNFGLKSSFPLISLQTTQLGSDPPQFNL